MPDISADVFAAGNTVEIPARSMTTGVNGKIVCKGSGNGFIVADWCSESPTRSMITGTIVSLEVDLLSVCNCPFIPDTELDVAELKED